jgi:hypothetical protein
MTIYNSVIESKTYRKIIKHRETCSKWSNSFCLDCFGGGINLTITELENEGIISVLNPQ